MSVGLFRVPFFSMINFSKACGMGLNGIRSMMIENTMRIEYGILSRNDNMNFTICLIILEALNIYSLEEACSGICKIHAFSRVSTNSGLVFLILIILSQYRIFSSVGCSIPISDSLSTASMIKDME